jgi:hypothetical protein
MSIVENEERRYVLLPPSSSLYYSLTLLPPFNSTSSPFTPSTHLPTPSSYSPSKSPTKSNTSNNNPLRISLHTTLHTTHTQSDNIRALFSALTLPEEISQLAEMYAPPSPVYARGRGAGGGGGVEGILGGGGRGSRRPVSLPQTGSIRPLSLSIPISPYKPYSYNSAHDHEYDDDDDDDYDNEGRRLGAGAGVGAEVGKRATWNGSYSALAMAGSSPSGQMLRRREKRRSDLVGLFGSVAGTPTRVGSVKGRGKEKGKMREMMTTTATTATEREMLGQGQGTEEGEGGKKGGLRASRVSISAPVTPVLLGVEEEGGVESERNGNGAEVEAEAHFGMEALKLHKKRRQDGLSVFGLSPPSSSTRPHPNPYLSTTPSTPHRPFPPSALSRQAQIQPPTPTFSPGSRFTTLQPTSRHPLSVNALHHALQNALASKRYACSYLLALRFDGDGGDGDGNGNGDGADEEAYWEDVRSVMGLLTSMFADAAARLTEALEDAEDMRHREREAEAEASDEGVEDDRRGRRRGSVSPSPRARAGGKDSVRTMAQMMMMVPSADGFAPMPSQLARFGAHVDAISSAMNEARENLERCVASLREEEELPAFSSRGVGSSMEDPALLAYERLRRELGLALRECERGRERLLDLIAASNPSPEPPEEEDLPGLGHDVGSDESDKHDSSSPLLDFGLGGDELAGGGGGTVQVSQSYHTTM